MGYRYTFDETFIVELEEWGRVNRYRITQKKIDGENIAFDHDF